MKRNTLRRGRAKLALADVHSHAQPYVDVYRSTTPC
jgi:hypothetical protein